MPTPEQAPSALEILDIVDAHDHVIGQCRRSDMHQLGLRHRAVHIMVKNELGEWLLQKRAMHKDTNPGLWDSACAGHVDSREDYLDCALRELQEELGLCVESEALEPVFRVTPRPMTGNEFVWVYTLYIPKQTPMTLEAHEIDAVQWFEPRTLDQICLENPERLTDLVRHLWQQLRT